MNELIFKRIESKYLLSANIYEKLINELDANLTDNIYGNYTLYNYYFDNEDYDIIRKSLEKPIYKEKLRIRSYDKFSDTAYLELKKKYEGIVYKRRVSLPVSVVKQLIDINDNTKYLKVLKILDDYMQKTKLSSYEAQVLQEILYLINQYRLYPKVYLSYNRNAFSLKEDSRLRLTFDNAIEYSEELSLEIDNMNKTNLDKNDYYIMEIKTDGAIPFWFSELLSKLKIYPTSFSKYGAVFEKEVNKEGE